MPDDGYRVLADTTVDGEHVLESMHIAAVECFADKGKIVGGATVVHWHEPNGVGRFGVVGVVRGFATPEEKMRFAEYAAEEILAWGRFELSKAGAERKDNA